MNKDTPPQPLREAAPSPAQRIADISITGMDKAEMDMRMRAFEDPSTDSDRTRRALEIKALQNDLAGRKEYSDDGKRSKATFVLQTTLKFLNADTKKRRAILEDLANNPSDLMDFVTECEVTPWAKPILNAAEALQRHEFPESAKEMRALETTQAADSIRASKAALDKLNIR